MRKNTYKATVIKTDNQGDRVLLYINDNYHIIASPDCTVKVGDTIEYGPMGVNFGFLSKNEKK